MRNILVTLNSAYIKPLKVMLTSLFFNNPGEVFRVYLMHREIGPEEVEELLEWVGRRGHELAELRMLEDCFDHAPTVLYYTREMYYRLLAFQFLPPELDRILYLDPDILVLNPIRPIYEMELDDCLYAAAYHNIPAVREVNRIRLNTYDIDAYYNSGVLMMNLALQRREIDTGEIFSMMEAKQAKLLMPDQDILNALYAKRIRPLDETIYNYDVRHYRYYKMSSAGRYDMNFVLHHTVFLHFCGKRKPWNNQETGKFDALYKHYEKLALG